MKIKIDNLVNQFIYKLRRNIPSSEPVQYDAIQNSLFEKKNQQKYRQPYYFPLTVKGIFMAIDIVCILLIQTLATFQGFYQEHR